ncbi:MAG: type II toxin-antitoxin system RelE/ParE family toxin [Planctomycetes bacterium]|nr:type II toxin-antitoxin system RelE/ParE family toxin [Planctomycetota bacterium]
MKPVRVEPEADDELAAAASWYDAQRPGLGVEFMAAVAEAIERVQRMPAVHALVPGAPEDLPARQAHVGRYPYKVVFFDLPEVVHVIAFAHDRQRPLYWLRRAGG